MARLFTTTPSTTTSPELEIEIESPSKENSLPMTTKQQQQQQRMTNFKKLTQVSGKLAKLPPQELVTELKSIHDYLSPIDQDHVDRSELVSLAEQLASPSLVKHKDRAVRVLVACCIANILRLFAPDAPYSIDQFEGVAEPDGIYYNYHYFLLESLSTVKSVVLIFDLPQAEVLQRELIQMALDMLQPLLLKNVRLYLLELVQTLLEECDQVPGEIISEQLAPALLTTTTTTKDESTQSFVQELIRQCAEKLQGPLAIHFSDLLARVARGQESESTLTRVTHEAHEYAVQVAKLSLPAASSILGLLEEELKVESLEIRQASIHSLAQIFSHHQNRLNGLHSLWTSWQGRRNDKAPRCRIAWIRGASEIVGAAARHSNWSLCEQVLPLLVERLQDPDEKVRLVTIQNVAMELLPLARPLQDYSGPLLEALTDRCLDRKEDVQSAALTLCSDWLFTLLKFTNSNSRRPDGINVLVHKLLQLTFSESRVHSLAFLGYLERDILVRLARDFSDMDIRVEKLLRVLSIAFKDERSHSAYRALLRHKSQFLKAWTALLKLSRIPAASFTDLHHAKTVQVCQFLAERLPGVSELDGQRALLALPALNQSSSEAVLLQMLIDLAEGNTINTINTINTFTNSTNSTNSAFNLINRIEAHLKASTSISVALKRVITAALPFGSQISLNTALIGHLTTSIQSEDEVVPVLLQDLLCEFPQLFENRTAELISAVLNGPTPPSVIALAQYLSNTTNNINSSIRGCDRNLLLQLDAILLNLLHPPLGRSEGSTNFDPKSIASAAQILLILKRQSPTELIQDLILQLAQDERVQVKSALAALTGVVKLGGGDLVPHFEMIFDMIAQRLFPHYPAAQVEAKAAKKLKAAGEDELLAGWPGIRELASEFQVAVLSTRFLATLTATLIRQHGRIESTVDLDTISSIRSLSVGFFLTRLLEERPSKSGPSAKRLQYTLLKGLMTCLPDASAADLTSHLQPLFLALQDTDQRLRYKLATLLCRLIRNRRLSDAFIPLLFFAGAHESSALIKSTLRALLGEIIRSWPPDSATLCELLPLLIVYTVKHPDYSGSPKIEDFFPHRPLLSAYYEYFVEAVVDAKNCGSIYESVSRLKLFQFIPLDPLASHRMYIASEWAQEAIKSKCASHHWPLHPNNDITPHKSTMSLLVPDVLTELDEPAQIQNIHRVFSEDNKKTEPALNNKRFIIKK